MPRSPRAPLQVLVVGHTAERGGAELALVRLCAALREAPDDVPDEASEGARPVRGVEVQVVLLADGPVVALLRRTGTPVRVIAADPELVTAGRGTLATPSATALRRVAAAVRTVRALRRAMLDARPDLVHTTTLKADVLGLAAAWTCRIPVVWHVHDRIAPDYLPAVVVRVLRAVARRGPKAVVANSLATASTLPGVRDLTVAYPGFAPEQALAAPPRLDAARRPRVVGLLGRLSPTKGQLELVRAAPAVLARHPDVTFRLVGAPAFGAEDYARAVEAEVRRLGLTDRVEVAGFAADPAAALDGLAVCVHASPVPEPFGQVVVEAMVRGVPVVATDAGGVPEILRAGTAGTALGRLVPPGDVPALAAAVVQVLDDPRAAHDVAARAHAVALDRFAVATTARTVSATWRRAAGAVPPEPGPGTADPRPPAPAPSRTA